MNEYKVGDKVSLDSRFRWGDDYGTNGTSDLIEVTIIEMGSINGSPTYTVKEGGWKGYTSVLSKEIFDKYLYCKQVE
jgi:hypothetical protein